jgi:hypothetical protein
MTIGSSIRSHVKLITSTILNVAVLVLLMRRIYKVRRSKRTRWYAIHTRFHDYQLSHSSNMNTRGCNVGITDYNLSYSYYLNGWADSHEMLVLLMEQIHISRWDYLRWHDIRTKCHRDLFWRSRLVWGNTRQKGGLKSLHLFFKIRKVGQKRSQKLKETYV